MVIYSYRVAHHVHCPGLIIHHHAVQCPYTLLVLKNLIEVYLIKEECVFYLSYNNEMLNQACKKFKINKKQVRRIYEILRLKNTNITDKTAYLNYRLNVKNRLNAPFQVSSRFNCLLLKI